MKDSYDVVVVGGTGLSSGRVRWCTGCWKAPRTG